jgi:hypothetical protein
VLPKAAWGSAIHAFQDFYAHSNWVERAIDAGYTVDNVPTWQDWTKSDSKGTILQNVELHTGTHPEGGVNDVGIHASMNNDDPKRPNFDMAKAAIDMATPQIIDELGKMVGPECVKKIKEFKMNNDQKKDIDEAIAHMKVIARSVGKYE